MTKVADEADEFEFRYVTVKLVEFAKKLAGYAMALLQLKAEVADYNGELDELKKIIELARQDRLTDMAKIGELQDRLKTITSRVDAAADKFKELDKRIPLPPSKS